MLSWRPFTDKPQRHVRYLIWSSWRGKMAEATGHDYFCDVPVVVRYRDPKRCEPYKMCRRSEIDLHSEIHKGRIDGDIRVLSAYRPKRLEAYVKPDMLRAILGSRLGLYICTRPLPTDW